MTELLNEVNASVLSAFGVKYEIRQEYAIEYVEYILQTFLEAVGMTTEAFVHGSGKRKSKEQKLYEKIEDCLKKLKGNTAQKRCEIKASVVEYGHG